MIYHTNTMLIERSLMELRDIMQGQRKISPSGSLDGAIANLC
jgi:hypothetical protein